MISFSLVKTQTAIMTNFFIEKNLSLSAVECRKQSDMERTVYSRNSDEVFITASSTRREVGKLEDCLPKSRRSFRWKSNVQEEGKKNVFLLPICLGLAWTSRFVSTLAHTSVAWKRNFTQTHTRDEGRRCQMTRHKLKYCAIIHQWYSEFHISMPA